MSTTSSLPPRTAPRLLAFRVLLTATTGAVDATAFLTLGHVFASVMTGNLVLLGIAAGIQDGALAAAAGLAFAGYATGTVLGSSVSRHAPASPRRPPVGTVRALLAELVVLGGFTAGWEAGVPEQAMLVLAALAMGCQSAAVRRLDSGVSTTFLTGTLTGLLADLVGARGLDVDAAARLVGLAAGAGAAAFVAGTRPACCRPCRWPCSPGHSAWPLPVADRPARGWPRCGCADAIFGRLPSTRSGTGSASGGVADPRQSHSEGSAPSAPASPGAWPGGRCAAR